MKRAISYQRLKFCDNIKVLYGFGHDCKFKICMLYRKPWLSLLNKYNLCVCAYNAQQKRSRVSLINTRENVIQGASATLNNAEFQEFSLLLHNHGFFCVVIITEYTGELMILGKRWDINQITLLYIALLFLG